MASTTNVRKLPAKSGRGGAADRRAYAAAVLSGIYAASGLAILNAKNHEYAGALRNARRIAFDQADEMLKGQA